MSQTLASATHSLTLLNYANDGLKEQIKPNLTKNTTLDGSLYIDFINIRNGWTIKFDIITAAQYNSLKQLYNDQFANEALLTFTDTDLGISKTVFLNMPAERNIKWNKTVVEGLIITLEPEDASSQL
jgi:hypothetical protein